MVDQTLLDILVCPETKQPLTIATAAVLESLNASIASGATQTRDGTPVSDPVDEGLVREDGNVLYPVRDGIPIMLINDSIPLTTGA